MPTICNRGGASAVCTSHVPGRCNRRRPEHGDDRIAPSHVLCFPPQNRPIQNLCNSYSWQCLGPFQRSMVRDSARDGAGAKGLLSMTSTRRSKRFDRHRQLRNLRRSLPFSAPQTAFSFLTKGVRSNAFCGSGLVCSRFRRSSSSPPGQQKRQAETPDLWLLQRFL
jgi:hypothetical protein